MLKKILLTLGTVLGVILVIGFFAKKEFHIEREIVINKPSTVVFSQLKKIKEQDTWSVWGKLDPNMKKGFTGTDGTVGAIASWDGNKDVGAGEQEIKKIVEGQRIDLELRFKKPFEDVAQVYFTTEAVGANQTKVKWAFDGKGRFPFNIICFFMNMNEMMGKDLQGGLDNLKTKLEGGSPTSYK